MFSLVNIGSMGYFYSDLMRYPIITKQFIKLYLPSWTMRTLAKIVF